MKTVFCRRCHATLGETDGVRFVVGGVIALTRPTPLACFVCGRGRVWVPGPVTRKGHRASATVASRALVAV